MESIKLDTRRFGSEHQLLRLLWLATLIIAFQSIRSYAANYTSTAAGNWNNPAIWSGGVIPAASDNVTIQHAVFLTANATCASLTVQSGKLTFATSAGRSYTLRVNGNVSVNSLIEYGTSSTGRYSFQVGGNFNNFGQVNLYASGTNKVDLQFIGNTDSRINNFSGSWNIGEVEVGKNGRNNSLDVLDNNFENGLRRLRVSKGTYIHDNPGIFNVSPAENYIIGPQAIFHVPAGSLGFSTAADSLTLQGELHVTGGTVNIGNSNGTGGIVYDRIDTTVIPFLNIASGGLQVKGGITHGTYSAGEPFRFSMFAGFLLLNGGTTGTRRQVFCITDVRNSNFTMNGGTITLVKPNSNIGYYFSDFSICGMNGTVNTTGGTVQFGQMATLISKGFSFTPFYNPANTSFTFPHFVVAAPYPVGGSTLSPAAGSTSNFNVLSLQVCVAAKFDLRAINGSTTGDGRIMSIKGANSGVAFANSGVFMERTSTVRFFPPNGANIPQRITGMNPASITFYRLDIANANHVTLQFPVKVANYLSLTSGKLNTTALNIVTCLTTANTSSGGTSAYVNGPMIHTVTSTSATKYYPIGKDAVFRPVELQLNHSDNNAVTYEGEVFNIPANTLPPCLPSSIASVSNVRYTKFTRLGPAQFLSGSITMHYGNDDGVSDLTSLIIAQETYPIPSCWMNLGQDITGTSSLVQGWIRSDIARFNPLQPGSNYFATDFSLANPPGGGNYLPVSMVEFGAQPVRNTVLVNWETETEINCDHFSVERSNDGYEYTEIGEVSGHGNTSDRTSYTFTDDQPIRGLSYYRLRQTDFDGHATVYGPVSVRSARSTFTVYPNPTSVGEVRLMLDGAPVSRFTAKVHDAVGREIPFFINNEDNGEVRLLLASESTRQGAFYIITLTDGVEVFQEKLIIQ